MTKIDKAFLLNCFAVWRYLAMVILSVIIIIGVLLTITPIIYQQFNS